MEPIEELQTFAPYTWADGEAGGTPITAEQLNKIEQFLSILRVFALMTDGQLQGLQAEVNSRVSAVVATANEANMKANTLEGQMTGVQEQIDLIVARLDALEGGSTPA